MRIRRGLDLPIEGAPQQAIGDGAVVETVALVGPDYVGMKPTLAVKVGDHVKTGQVLFGDKKTPGVKYTSPGCGRVVAIHRGQKRAFQSVVVQITGDEAETFAHWPADRLDRLDGAEVRANLIDSGLWTAFRTRPFSKVPAPESAPASIFVTAIDTNPLAARPEVVVAERVDDFVAGLRVLGRLGGRRVFVCKAPDAAIPGADLPGVTVVEFAGPHPAGLPGTHIHFLDPVGRRKTVWHVGYQDVIAMGHLFTRGQLDPARVISLAGPGVAAPRLVRTRLGANIGELVAGEVADGHFRVISGSVFSGRTAQAPLDFLGRYHLQVSTLPVCQERRLFDWLMPGFRKFSIKRVTVASLLRRKFSLSTSMGGRRRAIVPIGSYERVMPLDILPTFLLRALEMDDLDQAEALGCLELDEEDLALCTFVCPGKGEYGSMLRRNLTVIEREG